MIRFYSTKGEYGCFSNFSRHPVKLDVEYPTSEHFFQSRKFFTTDPDWAKAIIAAKTPSDCAKMGRDRSKLLRPDWEEKKDDFMRIACFHKFLQHEDCRKILLDTGESQLIEATTDDYYWGEGTDKTGKNMLGIILMEIRAVFAAERKLQHRLEAIGNQETADQEDEDMLSSEFVGGGPAIRYINSVTDRIG